MPMYDVIPGLPCRYQLLTQKPAAVVNFYQELCGWDVRWEAAGEHAVFTYLGQDVASVATASGAAGWAVGICAADTAAAADLVAASRIPGPVGEAPGATLVPVQDPAGVVLQAVEPTGRELLLTPAGEPGTITWQVYRGLASWDEAKQQAIMDFYATMFGWVFKAEAGIFNAFLDGGIIAAFSFDLTDEAAVGWYVYAGVEKVRPAVKRVPSLGGEVLLHADDALVADPAGNILGLVAFPAPEATAEPIHEGDNVFDQLL